MSHPIASSSVVGPAPTVLTQKRFSARTKFELGEEEFTYTLEAQGNKRTYQIEYAQLSRDRESLVDRNQGTSKNLPIPCAGRHNADRRLMPRRAA